MEPVSFWLRYYSSVKRSRRKNKNQDEWMPCILEANESSKEYRKNWGRLIQKTYACPPVFVAEG